MGGDHQRGAARRVLGRGPKDSGCREPPQIAARPHGHAEGRAGECGRQRAPARQRRVGRAARRAVGKVRRPRQALALRLVKVLFDSRLFRDLHRDRARRQRILLVLRQLLVHELHRERHRRGGDQPGERAQKDSVHRPLPQFSKCF